jgi:hypothetical protein
LPAQRDNATQPAHQATQSSCSQDTTRRSRAAAAAGGAAAGAATAWQVLTRVQLSASCDQLRVGSSDVLRLSVGAGRGVALRQQQYRPPSDSVTGPSWAANADMHGAKCPGDPQQPSRQARTERCSCHLGFWVASVQVNCVDGQHNLVVYALLAGAICRAQASHFGTPPNRPLASCHTAQSAAAEGAAGLQRPQHLPGLHAVHSELREADWQTARLLTLLHCRQGGAGGLPTLSQLCCKALYIRQTVTPRLRDLGLPHHCSGAG